MQNNAKLLELLSTLYCINSFQRLKMGRYNNFLQKGVYCKHLVSSSVDVDILGQIELLNIKSNIDDRKKGALSG